MNTEEAEKKLRQLFDALREQQTLCAPQFEIIARPSTPADSSAQRSILWFRCGLGLAAVVVLVAAAGLVTLRMKRHNAEVELGQWAAFSDWRPLTDSLLQATNTPWCQTITAPSDSLIGNSETSDMENP